MIECVVLGCATSVGVPILGCPCAVCSSDNPKNVRSRVSILYIDHTRGIRLLVDTSPDLRQQLMRQNELAIDAVLFTHTHADHIFGLDDLRPVHFFHKRQLPIFGRSDHLQRIQNIFPYAFEAPTSAPVPVLIPHTVEAGTAFDAASVQVMPIEINHGNETILGYRMGPLAYLTDCSGVELPQMELLRGCECLILGALRYTPHEKHFSVDQAIEFAQQLGVKQLILTHMGHELEYEQLNADTPTWVQPAFDGMRIAVASA